MDYTPTNPDFVPSVPHLSNPDMTRHQGNRQDRTPLADIWRWQWLRDMLIFIGILRYMPRSLRNQQVTLPPRSTNTFLDVIRYDYFSLVLLLCVSTLIAWSLHVVLTPASGLDYFQYLLALIFLAYSTCTAALVLRAMHDVDHSSLLQATIPELFPGDESCAVCLRNPEPPSELVDLQCGAKGTPLHYFHESCLKQWWPRSDDQNRRLMRLPVRPPPPADDNRARVERKVDRNGGRVFLNFEPLYQGPLNDNIFLPPALCPLCQQTPVGFWRTTLPRPQQISWFESSRLFGYVYSFFADRVLLVVANPRTMAFRVPSNVNYDRHHVQVIMRALVTHMALVTTLLFHGRMFYLMWLTPLDPILLSWAVGSFVITLFAFAFQIGYRISFTARAGLAGIIKGLRLPRRADAGPGFLWVIWGDIRDICRFVMHILWVVFVVVLWDVVARALLRMHFYVSLFVLCLAGGATLTFLREVTDLTVLECLVRAADHTNFKFILLAVPGTGSMFFV